MAIVLAQQVAGGSANTAEVILFVIFGAIALGAGVAMITMRNIVHAALMLVVNFLAIAGLYLALQSSFLSIIQVIVYAGAIMVLFLFVIMLLGVDRDDLLVDLRLWHRVAAFAGVGLLAAGLLWGFAGTYTSQASRCGDQAPAATAGNRDAVACVGMDAALDAEPEGSVGVVATSLFGRYAFPFEAAAILLTVATIGALILGKRTEVPQDEDPAFEPSAPVPTEADLVDARVGAPIDADGVPEDASVDTDDPGEDA
jgi:NADH-quinone oxidoreductase subunit J